ncbi:unnamed protein product, partial [Prunus brigantina]
LEDKLTASLGTIGGRARLILVRSTSTENVSVIGSARSTWFTSSWAIFKFGTIVEEHEPWFPPKISSVGLGQPLSSTKSVRVDPHLKSKLLISASFPSWLSIAISISGGAWTNRCLKGVRNANRGVFYNRH